MSLQPVPGLALRLEKDPGWGSRTPHSYLSPYLAPGEPWGGGAAGWGPQGRGLRAVHWRQRPAPRSLHPSRLSLLPLLLRASRPRLLRSSKVGAEGGGHTGPLTGRAGPPGGRGLRGGVTTASHRPPATSPALIRRTRPFRSVLHPWRPQAHSEQKDVATAAGGACSLTVSPFPLEGPTSQPRRMEVRILIPSFIQPIFVERHLLCAVYHSKRLRCYREQNDILALLELTF